MKYSITLSLHAKAHKDGTRAVRFRVSWNSQSYIHYINPAIPATNWDADGRKVIPATHPAAKEISRLTTAVIDLFDRAHLDKFIPSMDDVRTALGDLQPQQPAVAPTTHPILQAMDAFVLEEAAANSWADATISRFRVIRSHIAGWDNTATVEDMDATRMKSFVGYMFAMDLINSSVSKNLQQLRWFLRWCRNKGWTTNDTWDTYRPKFKAPTAPTIVYLTADELHQLEELDLSQSDYLARVRDVFVFCCYTGLRYSDVAHLSWDDIHDNHISIVALKTSDCIEVDLNRHAQAILDRYRPADPHPHGRALPVISNQKMNDYLKIIAERAGIDAPVKKVHYVRGQRHEVTKPKHKLITTHCGRRTFVVLALSLGVSPQVVMKITGHSDYKAMLPYIDITSPAKRAAVDALDQL